jgi:hypothetical protein
MNIYDIFYAISNLLLNIDTQVDSLLLCTIKHDIEILFFAQVDNSTCTPTFLVQIDTKTNEQVNICFFYLNLPDKCMF